MEQQKILYTHKQCKLNNLETRAFSFLSFPFNQTEPQQRVDGYTSMYMKILSHLWLDSCDICILSALSQYAKIYYFNWISW